MDWHIITGSKGGVGKTLLALLLSAKSLEEQKGEKSTLVIDLNSTNVDFSRLLLYQSQLQNPIQLSIPKPGLGNETEDIVIQKTYSVNKQRQQHYYAVGWPSNVFKTFDSSLFINLLSTIKENVSKIEREFPSLQTIIIDTNYHFCNLFAQDNIHGYEEYTQGSLSGENITIWFMWVYRQLENLRSQIKYKDANIIRATAEAIERNINSTWCQKTPFIHVFGPAALMSSNPQEDITRRIYKKITQNEDYYFDQLKELEDLTPGECISFNDWIERFDVGYRVVKWEEDPRKFFLNILSEAARVQPKKGSTPQRPRNVIPLSIFHKELQFYTDGNYADVISQLQNFTLYDRFCKLINQNENFYLPNA